MYHGGVRVLADLHALDGPGEDRLLVVDVRHAHPHGGAAVARRFAVVSGDDGEVIDVVRNVVIVQSPDGNTCTCTLCRDITC